MTDQLHRYLFDDQLTRLQSVFLEDSWQEALQHQQYPDVVRNLLGELAAAAVLLAGNLKLQGSLILQAQGDGPIALLVVECTSDLELRATATLNEDMPLPAIGTLQNLLNPGGQGRFVAILEPDDKKSFAPYQGIVPLQGESVAEALQSYMKHSEQLDSQLFLAADENRAAGLLLQRLPAKEVSAQAQAPADEAGQSEDSWARNQPIFATLRRDELLTLSNEALIHRLFWQETLLQLPAQAVRWHCPCTRERVADMLRMLGQEEIAHILDEQGQVDVACEFCGQPYHFDAVDCAQLFASGSSTKPPAQLH